MANIGADIAGAAKADLGIAPMMAASPMTWMPAILVLSNDTGSTGHHPVRSEKAH